ncbi:MAG: ATP-binding protein [Candidatus Omnitrophica bacterium]|nr:ATP-binding protein [Candidatus Omnitrophota bacterium]
MELIRRFLLPPKQSFFLFGPRGTGKTTWLHQQVPDALTFDLLQPDLFRTFSARPERLREAIEGYPEKKHILVDEIQKIPELLPVVHSLIEKNSTRQFILTGSSARKLKRTGVDLLAGRALYASLHPFMAKELGKQFNLERALHIGLIPLIWMSKEPEKVLESYITLYLREEVQSEGLVRNLGNFSRFLEAISFSHSFPINMSNVSRECEIERKVVDGYVGILEDLLLAYRLPVFSKRAKRNLSRHSKFYFFDAGVYRTIRPKGPLDRSEEIGGCVLEGLIAQHLRAWIAYSKEQTQLYFWRTHSGVEVDFILYGSNDIIAIEVKNTTRVRPEDLRGLASFYDEYPESKLLFLYRGKERIKQKNILCMPCEDFLLQLTPDSPFPGIA